MKKNVSAIILFFLMAAPASHGAPAPVTAYPLSISFVNEMAYIPEVDSWEECAPGAFSADSIVVDSAWDTLHLWVQKQYTPATIRALSGWARQQMTAYKRTPKLKNLTFTPIRMYEKHNMLVFEAIADSLPVHAPIVTRWLKLYLLYDKNEHRIMAVTVTIRGRVLE